MKTLISALVRAVADDESIAAWSMATYGRAHQVKGYHDAREAPLAAADCPLVFFRPAEKAASRTEISHTVRAVLFLWDNAVEVQPRDNLAKYEVVDYMDDLADYVRSAILGAEDSLSNTYVTDMVTTYDSAEGVPLQQATMIIRLVGETAFGADFQ